MLHPTMTKIQSFQLNKKRMTGKWKLFHQNEELTGQRLDLHYIHWLTDQISILNQSILFRYYVIEKIATLAPSRAAQSNFGCLLLSVW